MLRHGLARSRSQLRARPRRGRRAARALFSAAGPNKTQNGGESMVVKGRTPHRRACLCCAEAGALPFSLRRANGDAALDDTWSGLAGSDDDAVLTVATPSVEPIAEVRALLHTCFNTRAPAPRLTGRRRCDSNKAWPRQSAMQVARRSLTRKLECQRRRTRHWPPASAPARDWPLASCVSHCSSHERVLGHASRQQHTDESKEPTVAHRSAVSPAAPTKLSASTDSERRSDQGRLALRRT